MSLYSCGDSGGDSGDNSGSSGTGTGGTGGGSSSGTGGGTGANPGLDLKSCKTLKYNNSAKTELKLTDQSWCGDIKDRFRLENKGNDFIYDSMLKGYWSKSYGAHVPPINKNHSTCQNLGNGYVYPDIYKLLSLMSQTKDANQGYINPIFSDTGKTSHQGFYSITPWTKKPTSDAWYVSFKYGKIDRSDDAGSARCFRPE